MTMILKMMNGDSHKITDQEFEGLNTAGQMVHFKSCNVLINKSRIENIYPENTTDNLIARKQQQTGVLHDGSRVKRYFGEWVDEDNTAVDDNGKYTPVKIDKNYYPEIAYDTVATEEEYKKIKEEKLDYYQVVGMQNKTPRIENGEFKQIGEIIN